MNQKQGIAIETQFSSTIKMFCITFALLMPFHASAQSTIEPPSIGQETKGTPAIVETENSPATIRHSVNKDEENQSKSLFGRAKVTELRRDSGQVYLIELEHPLGAKQYIEETDSDGKIESTSNDIEETPNLPKWRLGSW